LIKISITLRKFIASLCLVFSFEAFSSSISDIKIAAGSMGGAYYPVALQFCSFITKYSPITNCDVISTSGSINNLNLLSTEKVDFAFVQSDVALDAFRGEGVFSNQKPYSDLRIVLNLFPEVFSVMTRGDSGIVNFSDLSGKKIGVNLKGSGAMSGFMNLFKYFKFDKDPQIIQVADSGMPAKLCGREVDVVVLFTGHPSSVASSIASYCKTEFVSIDPIKLGNMITDTKVYESYTIPSGFYSGILRNTGTFATRAIFTANADTPSSKVALIKGLIDKHFEEFQKLHPVLTGLQRGQVFSPGTIVSY